MIRCAIGLFCLTFLAPAIASCQIPAQANSYRPQLTREARAHWGLDAPVAIFAAQLHQESAWKETARSHVGALGLAQFMPGTAQWISQLYPQDLGANQPLDARWAIRALVMYDRWLYDRLAGFKDDGLHRWAATLASYNGGLGHLQKEQRVAAALNTCSPDRYFCCVQSHCGSAGRASWACRENTQYPVRILLIIEPRYRAAGW